MKVDPCNVSGMILLINLTTEVTPSGRLVWLQGLGWRLLVPTVSQKVFVQGIWVSKSSRRRRRGGGRGRGRRGATVSNMLRSRWVKIDPIKIESLNCILKRRSVIFAQPKGNQRRQWARHSWQGGTLRDALLGFQSRGFDAQRGSRGRGSW